MIDRRVVVPRPCPMLSWRIAIADGSRGVDASQPASARLSGFWFLAERHGFLRSPDGQAGQVRIVVRWRDGRETVRTTGFPAADAPPFYAVVGARPTHVYRADGFALPIWGTPPDVAGLEAVHGEVLTALARLRRDVVGPGAPRTLDFAWLPRLPGMMPGYAASAGAQAIGAQVMSRTGDPDGATKARAVIASSAVHEGFHAIVAPIGRGWPAWINESLANHFALRAARKFLAPGDMAFLDAIFAETDTRPLIEAQRQYDRDPDAARDLFYRRGPVFWTRIETVLVNRPNGSGRLAALLRATKGFCGVDTNDAAALAAFLDRYSAGRARSIAYCYLEGRCASPSATGTG